MRTANPVLNAGTFNDLDLSMPADRTMTVQGAINKTFVLLAMVVAGAVWTWKLAADDNPLANALMWGGLIGGFIVALITIFKPRAAPVTAPIYGVLQGLFLGGISAFFDAMYPGIVIQAVGLTFGVTFVMLAGYAMRIVRATEKFKMGVVAATGAVALMYIVTIILSFFGVSVPFIHGNGLLGIGVSVVIVIIAALNLVLDFDFIEQGAQRGAPRHMEWYAAFGLMVTLIWLYIEILRLLAKVNSRR